MVKHYIKKLIRPLIPDRLMARVRLRQHSKHIRWNVDIFAEDRGSAGRWKDSTPDTYRVRLQIPDGEQPSEVTILTDPEYPLSSGEIEDRALRALSDPWLGAVVAGETLPPKIANRRRAEPVIGPRFIAVRNEVLAEVGGAPAAEHPLPGLLARIRDAGHPIGLLPLRRTGAPTVRSDPISLPPVIILAVVPMHDIGGGARSTQIALELLRRGFHVVLVTLFEAQESVDLGLRFTHPELEQYSILSFDREAILSRVDSPGLMLVEAPAPQLVDQAFAFQGAGWEIVYDIIDDWSDPSLGGGWFEAEVEDRLLRFADRIVGSAPDLTARAGRVGRTADLVPNAVNAEIFGGDLPPEPDDLPEASTLIGYHGSLYGDWFDWKALIRVAEALPEAAVIVIGDNKAPHPPMPANVHFLGLKPQTDLPAYLQRLDVGIIPFKLTDTTHAVSPLKAYEYLASGVPVAAPPLRALERLEGVSTNVDLLVAVRGAMEGSRPDRASQLVTHSWAQRIEQILGRCSEVERSHGPNVLVTQRPAVHWARGDRMI